MNSLKFVKSDNYPYILVEKRFIEMEVDNVTMSTFLRLE